MTVGMATVAETEDATLTDTPATGTPSPCYGTGRPGTWSGWRT